MAIEIRLCKLGKEEGMGERCECFLIVCKIQVVAAKLKKIE